MSLMEVLKSDLFLWCCIGFGFCVTLLCQTAKRKRQDQGKPYRPKHAMHLIRLLHSGIEALRGKGVLVDVGRYRQELLHIREGGMSFEEVNRRALELDREFQDAFAKTALPDRPDVARVDRFLIEARKSRAHR